MQPSIQSQANLTPVSIVTGFLGSGKTTLLNHLVKQPGMESVALIINEFGEVGLDDLLVETSIENTLLLENGCICCTVRGDLIDTISDLFSKVRHQLMPSFSRILIETTGLADPIPIVNTIATERVLAERCQLDTVLTVIDGVQGAYHARSNPEAIAQIALADVGLVSKRDMINETQAQEITKFVRAINPGLELEMMEHGKVDPAVLFSQHRMATAERQSRADQNRHAGHDHADHDHDDHHHESRHHDITTWSYVGRSPLDRHRFYDWLRMVYSLRGHSMLRLKGFVWVKDQSGPLLVQAVGPVLSPVQEMENWPYDTEQTRLTFIIKNLPIDALKQSFQRHVVAPSQLPAGVV